MSRTNCVIQLYNTITIDRMKSSSQHPPLASGRKTSNVVENLERQWAREILRGTLAPGSRLPSVRTLATQHQVASPTIHRVIDRLESSGLVAARRGSGVTVLDPRNRFELALLPTWFEALDDQPVKAAKILGDFLELRRVVAAHLVRKAGRKVRTAVPALTLFIAELESAKELAEVVRLDLLVSRSLAAASDQFAVNAILHTTERLVYEVPYLAEALYEPFSAHRALLRKATRLLGEADDSERIARELERALARWDRRSIARFQSLLETRNETGPRAG